MPTILMLKGLPASGKTTYAKEKVKRDSNWVRVNKDDIRRNLFAGQRSVPEKLVIQTEDALIRFFMTKNKNVIVDDTNLNPHHERRLQMLIEKHNKSIKDGEKYQFETLFFETPLPICIDRNMGRSGEEFVPVAAIQEMYDKYLKSPEADDKNELAEKDRIAEGLDYIKSLNRDIAVIRENEKKKKVIQDESLPSVILCDIDGCAALMGKRSPFEWGKVHLDTPNRPVINLVDLLWSHEDGPGIVFMSGRSEDCRELTKEWIRKHTTLKHPELYMRKAGDNRKDSIVKEELYREHIQPNYFVDFILDDRNQVVQMWRDLGLTCFQVAEGSF